MQFVASSRWTRVLGYLLVLYIINFVDRHNIGFAVIGGMDKDLHIGPAEAGLSGGIFSLGYILLQVPSGILVEKYDAKTLIAFFTVAWGAVAAATGFAQNGTELLILRFLLGLIDGGVWTMILVVLARWFPGRDRAKANSIWLTSLPLAFIIMAPISGLLLSEFDWRALFIIEGVPAIFLGLLYFLHSASRPEDASWLRASDRARILGEQAVPRDAISHDSYRAAVLDHRVMLLGATYCLWMVGVSGVFMWAPAIIKSLTHHGALATGLLSTLPYVAGLVGLLVIGRFSDRTGQRGRLVSLGLFGLGLFLLASVLVHNEVLSLAFLVCAGFFLFAPHAPFWAIPAELFTGERRGAAMGMISLIGNIGTFFGPYAVGYVRQETGSFVVGEIVLVGSLWIGALLATQLKDRAAPVIERIYSAEAQ
jgi:sugar phosphate permease